MTEHHVDFHPVAPEDRYEHSDKEQWRALGPNMLYADVFKHGVFYWEVRFGANGETLAVRYYDLPWHHMRRRVRAVLIAPREEAEKLLTPK